MPRDLEDPAGGVRPSESVYGLLRGRERTVPQVLPKWALLRLSNALEDCYLERAERGVVLATFQRADFYLPVSDRWRLIAMRSELAAVLAAFDHASAGCDRALQLDLPVGSPLRLEWNIVIDCPLWAICLSAREISGDGRVADRDRRFEAIWTVQPTVVREAARRLLAVGERSWRGVGRLAPSRVTDPGVRLAVVDPDPVGALCDRLTFHAARSTPVAARQCA